MYTYPETSAGFAERNAAQISKGIESDFDDCDFVSSQLAWSRALSCLRRAFGAGSDWAVMNIETVWEEYWDRLLSELDGVKRQGSQGPVPGLAIEILDGKDQSQGGEGLAVECVPTKAGGMFPIFHVESSFVESASRLNAANCSRNNPQIFERVLQAYLHPQWPGKPAHPASIADCGRGSDRRRDVIFVLSYRGNPMDVARSSGHKSGYQSGRFGCC